MVPKHLRKSDEGLGGDQEDLMTSYLGLQGKIKNDKSVLRQPIDTGVRGVRDLMKAVVGGTEELQELLLNECTIIYECKICRNLFRSLANFISHKRIYCVKNFTYFTGATEKLEQNDINFKSDMVNGNKDVNLTETKVWLTNNRIVPNNIKTEKNNCIKPSRRIKISPVKITRKCDIAKIADGLNKKARIESLRKNDQEIKFSSDIAERVMMRRCKVQGKISADPGKLNSNHTDEIFLGPPDDGNSSIKNCLQLEVIDRLVPCNEAVLQENGKFRVTPQGMQLESNADLQKYKCSLCETHFITNLALSRHIQVHHKERICYPCPICRTFFPSPSSTYRHLSKDHHKTEQQIRRLRPKVLAKAIKRKLVDGNRKLEKISQEEPQRLNENWEGVLRCVGCGKLFNRQAVLRVHLTSCKESQPPKLPANQPNGKSKQVLPPVGGRKQEQRKSGILVRRDYSKKFNCDVKSITAGATNPTKGTNLPKAHSLKRINKWRTVLKKLQNKTEIKVSEKPESG